LNHASACRSEIVTLGLFTLVINGLLFWLVGALHVRLDRRRFWAAFWGAILMGSVSWILSMLTRGDDQAATPLSSLFDPFWLAKRSCTRSILRTRTRSPCARSSRGWSPAARRCDPVLATTLFAAR